MRKFTTETRVYESNGFIDAEGCTDIEFYNGGTTALTINNRPLPLNQWWSINAFPDEVNAGRYQVIFTGGTGKLIVTRRVYKK